MRLIKFSNYKIIIIFIIQNLPILRIRIDTTREYCHVFANCVLPTE